MCEIDYSLAWKLETICPATTAYFPWIYLVSIFLCDDAIFVNEIGLYAFIIDYLNNQLIDYNTINY